MRTRDTERMVNVNGRGLVLSAGEQPFEHVLPSGRSGVDKAAAAAW